MSVESDFTGVALCADHGRDLNDECSRCLKAWNAVTKIVDNQIKSTDESGEKLSRAGGRVQMEAALGVQIHTLLDVLLRDPLDRALFEAKYAEAMQEYIDELARDAQTKKIVMPNSNGLS